MRLTHKASLGLALLGSFGLSAVVHAQTPVSWWKGDGNALDSTGGNNGTLQGGVTYGPGVVNQGFVFNGTNGTVQIPDAANLAITGSLSITAYINVQQLPTLSEGFGQIFFRGDSRGAFDPYYLGVSSAGNLVFQIADASNNQAFIQAPISLQQFDFVSATLNDATGLMQLSINNQVVAQTTTTIRPFSALNPAFNPGIGIGNTQDLGVANQPFDGTIDELKIYNTVAAVPEASTTASLGLLLVLGLGGLVIAAKRRKASAS